VISIILDLKSGREIEAKRRDRMGGLRSVERGCETGSIQNIM
jgi:hypothetical protein